MSPSDSPRSQKMVIDSHRLLDNRWTSSIRPPRRVSQVPRLICRCPLSPITPGRPVVAYTCCFATGSRLHQFRQDGHDQWCNEAESGSLALRLTPSPHRASTAGSPRHPPAWLHGQQAITMICTFQQTRSARLSLAHRRHGDTEKASGTTK